MEEIIKYLEDMAATLDGVTDENWLDTPEDIARIYRSVAAELRAIAARKAAQLRSSSTFAPTRPDAT